MYSARVVKNNNVQRDFEPRRSFNYDLTCDTAAKQTLNYYCQQELIYHNTLVDGLNSALRAYPEAVYEMASNPYSWLAAAQSERVEGNPTSLQKSLLNIAAGPGRLLPEMRIEMAGAILAHVKPQAESLIQLAKRDSMKSPVQILPIFEFVNRRHITLYRTHIKCGYNADTKTTLISTPYAATPLKVVEENIEKLSWASLTIRQTPDIAVDINSPWTVTLNRDARYNITLCDNNSRSRRKFEMRGINSNDRDH